MTARRVASTFVVVVVASCSQPAPARPAVESAQPQVSRTPPVPPLVAQTHGAVLTPATPRDAGLSDAAISAAVTLYREAVDTGKVAGAVLLVARHGKVVVHQAFGVRNTDARSPMETTTMFRMSSNTKAVTAAAVALLADRGRLRFTDPVSVHIPSWDNRRARAITIHHLLSHTSGIRIDALFAPRWIRWPWSRPPTLRSETDRIGSVGAEATPGSEYFYTNAGYNALGGLVETVSGRPLDMFLRDEIFTPLGMADSYGFEAAEKLDGKISRMGPTYTTGERGGWMATWKPGDPPEVPFARGSGGLVTTAWDYAVFMQMLLNGGIYGDVRLLRPGTVRAMLTAHTPSGARGYGYGWGINDDGVFTHSGSTGTYAWGDPRSGILVVALTQTPSASDMRPRMMEILKRGFVVIPGPVPPDRLDQLADAYTAAVASATGEDVRIGSTTTRVSDFVNRGAAFDDLYVFPPLLDACSRVIGRPFKLSSLHARTVRPGVPAQPLHADVRRDSADWPLVGFILMVDEFRMDNGATRFVPGSHRWPGAPEDAMSDLQADHDEQVLACGRRGSLIVFNGSTWHGHAANTSSAPRRSLQGAFIPRAGRAGTDFAARMSPDVRARLSPLARYVLAL